MTRLLTAWLFAIVTTSAYAATVGWRIDGTGRSTATPPSTVDPAVPAWSTSLPAISNSSPIVVGGKICGTAEPTTLWCADAASGRLVWQAKNEWTHTVPASERPAAEARIATGEAAIAELAVVQAEYGRLQREARRTTTDPTLFTRLTELSGKLDQLKRAADDIKDLRAAPARDVMGWAAPTPVSDGTAIYAAFANGVVSKFDLAGTRLWSVWLGPHKVAMRGFHEGSTASPALAGDALIVPYISLQALDTRTGAVRWSTGSWRDYGSPAVGNVGGNWVIATPDGRLVNGRDGRELARGLGDLFYASPIIDGDRAFWFGSSADAHSAGTGSVTVRAFRLAASGTSVSPQPLWSVNVPIPDRFYATALHHEGLLYQVSRDRQLVVLDAANGALVYQQVLPVRAETWTNPIYAGGRIWIVSAGGELLWVKPGRSFQLLGQTKTDPMLATPAFSGSRVYLRTQKRLVAVGG